MFVICLKNDIKLKECESKFSKVIAIDLFTYVFYCYVSGSDVGYLILFVIESFVLRYCLKYIFHSACTN